MSTTEISSKGDDHSDVLVVGGGVIGTCSAYFLAEAGLQVTIVDQDDICAGSSYGNAGLVVPSHCVPLAAPGVLWQGLRWMFNPESPFYIRPRFDMALFSWLWRFRSACSVARRDRAMPLLRDITFKSVELYDAFAAMEDMRFGYQKSGVLHIFRTDKGLRGAEHEAELLRRIGVEAHAITPSDIEDRLGALKSDVKGGVYYPQDAHLWPAEFVRALARKVEGMDGRVLSSAKVLGFATDGRRITAVKTTRGVFTADEVVIASGSWTPALMRHLGLKAPIQPAKGYSVTYKRTDGVPNVPFICGEDKVAVTPMGETVRLSGTLELAGMDSSNNQRRVDAIVRSPGRYLPGLERIQLELVEVWAGLRPCTPHGLPLLGRSPSYDNLTIAAGHAMIGMSTGPATGKLVAQVVTGQPTFVDLKLLYPARFG